MEQFFKFYCLLHQVFPDSEEHSLYQYITFLYMKLPRNEELVYSDNGYVDECIDFREYDELLMKFPYLDIPYRKYGSSLWKWSVIVPNDYRYVLKIDCKTFDIVYSIWDDDVLYKKHSMASRSMLEAMTYVNDRMCAIYEWLPRGAPPDDWWSGAYLGNASLL